MEARWLERLLDQLAPYVASEIPQRFLHGDSQTTNMMVRPGSLEYLAVLDWGSSGWGDVAWDFLGIPLRAVPFMLSGHRQIDTLDGDETAGARILWRHLQIAIWLMRPGPQPTHSWAERPLAMFRGDHAVLARIKRLTMESLFAQQMRRDAALTSW